MTRLLLNILLLTLCACQVDPREMVPNDIKWKQSTRSEETSPKTTPLEFMIAPWLSRHELLTIYEPLITHLSNHLGEPVRINIAPNYPTLLKLIKNGKIDIAQVNARSLQTLIVEDQNHHYLGTTLHVTDGTTLTTSSKGLLLASRPLDLTPNGVRKLRLGLIDPNSTSGYLLPKIWLAQHGLNFNQFKDTLFLGSHSKAFQALLSGRVELIASWNGQLVLEAPSGPEEVIKISETGLLPNDAWVTAGTRRTELLAKLQSWAHALPDHNSDPVLFPTTRVLAGIKPIPLTTYLEIPRLED